MAKGIFITATGTDVGKTYVSALILKKLIEGGEKAIYYKAALSGAKEDKDSKLIAEDASYVFEKSGIELEPNDYVSYIYKHAYSPHLAAQIENRPLELSKVYSDYKKLQEQYDYIVAEGSGGLVCPLRLDDQNQIMLTDVIKKLGLDIIIVSQSGLGSINSTILTINYAKSQNIDVKGIVLNNYDKENPIHRDNKIQLEKLSGIEVLALVGENEDNISIEIDKLK